MPDKSVAIIVLIYNGSEYIGDLFTSLEKINYRRDKFEIVIVDNASTDKSVEMMKNIIAQIHPPYPPLSKGGEGGSLNLNCHLIVNEKNLGFAAGNNIGLQYAIDKNFDYVYLLNQDTVVEPDFLANAIKVIESEQDIAAVQSRLMHYKNKEIINSIGNCIHFLGFGYAGGNGESAKSYKQKAISSEITYASGAAVLIRIDHLKKIGLLNKDFFMYHEDLDWGWRAWLKGYKILLAPESVVYHKYEFSRSIKKYYYMERNRRLVLLQNYKLPTLILISPVYFLMSLMMLSYSFLAGWGGEQLKVVKYFLNFKNWQQAFICRRAIQQSRKVRDKFMLDKFVGMISYQETTSPILKYAVNPFLNICFILIKGIVWW